MSQQSPKWKLDSGITPEEAQLIGMIIVEFAAIEHVMFIQTLESFENASEDKPKTLNGIQFSETLKYWKARVASTSDETISKVLLEQHTEIKRLQEYRDALVHGLFTWSPTEPQKLTAQRTKKHEYIKVTFSINDLRSFQDRISDIHFKIRHPSGPEDMISSMIESGGYIDRSFCTSASPSSEAEQAAS